MDRLEANILGRRVAAALREDDKDMAHAIIDQVHGLSRPEIEVAGRRVAVALAHGNADWAHAIIDDVVRRRGDNLADMTITQRMASPVAALLGDDEMTINHLERMGINTIGQLLETPAYVLLESRNFGEKRLQKLIRALRRIGFELGKAR